MAGLVDQELITGIGEKLTLEFLGFEFELNLVVTHHLGVSAALAEIERDFLRRAKVQLQGLGGL